MSFSTLPHSHLWSIGGVIAANFAVLLLTMVLNSRIRMRFFWLAGVWLAVLIAEAIFFSVMV
jgi:apolipoprotein N-acyltransferase